MPPSAAVTTAQSAVKSAARSVTSSVAKDVADGVATAAKEGVKRPNFPLGKKQLFLPKHVLTFIRPKPGQPPNLATFKVPLTFNKFDFRDYLWNVYNVEVTSVRSFINQLRAKQRETKLGGRSGKWYRPRPIKMMIADLKQPFIWPEVPEDKDPWDHKLFMGIEKSSHEQTKQYQAQSSGRPHLRSRGLAGPTRAHIAQAAKLLAYGLQKWKPQAETAKIVTQAKDIVPISEKEQAELEKAKQEKAKQEVLSTEDSEAAAETREGEEIVTRPDPTKP